MKKNWTVICFLVALTLPSLLVIGQKKTRDEGPDVSQFPILDYQTQSAIKSSNQKNRKKYNNRHAPRISESTDGIFSIVIGK